MRPAAPIGAEFQFLKPRTTVGDHRRGVPWCLISEPTTTATTTQQRLTEWFERIFRLDARAITGYHPSDNLLHGGRDLGLFGTWLISFWHLFRAMVVLNESIWAELPLLDAVRVKCEWIRNWQIDRNGVEFRWNFRQRDLFGMNSIEIRLYEITCKCVHVVCD